MNILITDDHAIVRKGIIELLKDAFQGVIVREAANSQEALELVRKNTPDLILLDVSMPGRNGIDTLKQMRHEGIKAPILILSMQPEDQYAIRALKAGASGFVNKGSATEELVTAIHRVLGGNKYISSHVANLLASGPGDDSQRLPHERLSDREMQVLQLIASGKTVSEIAEIVLLSVNTINTYRARLLEKMSLQNNAELTRYALDNGLL